MSLGIVIKGPEGLVLAAESRVTLGRRMPNGDMFYTSYDNATKLLSFSKPNDCVGAVTYGNAFVGHSGRTAHSFIPEFETKIENEERLPVEKFAEKMRDFYLEQWKMADIPNYQVLPWFLSLEGITKRSILGGYFYSRYLTTQICGNKIQENVDLG